MKNQIYLLHNRLTCRFGSIFSFPTDAYAVKVLTQQLNENHLSLDEYTLYNVGSYDISTGFVDTSELRVIPWNVSTPLETEAK